MHDDVHPALVHDAHHLIGTRVLEPERGGQSQARQLLPLVVVVVITGAAAAAAAAVAVNSLHPDLRIPIGGPERRVRPDRHHGAVVHPGDTAPGSAPLRRVCSAAPRGRAVRAAGQDEGLSVVVHDACRSSSEHEERARGATVARAVAAVLTMRAVSLPHALSPLSNSLRRTWPQAHPPIATERRHHRSR